MAIPGTPSLTFYSRHPYLPGADALLGRRGIPSVRDLAESPVYAEVRRQARASLDHAIGNPATPRPSLPEAESDPATAFLSFQYCRLLLSMPKVSPTLFRRWCLATAKSAWGNLVAPGNPGDPDLRSGELTFVANELGLSVSETGDKGVCISVPSYVRMAAHIRESHYRLARQKLDGSGGVIVKPQRAARLLQEGIRVYLLSLPHIELSPALVGLLDQQEGEYLTELNRRIPLVGDASPGVFNPAFFPPCIREMKATMERGENLSHFGRFSLAAYLHRLRAGMDFMVECYRGAPDFDEEVTRYQLEHITHHDDGKGYTPPECATIVTNGLCFKERDTAGHCKDPSLKNPMNYYLRMVRSDRTQSAPRVDGAEGAGGLSREDKVKKEHIEGAPSEP